MFTTAFLFAGLFAGHFAAFDLATARWRFGGWLWFVKQIGRRFHSQDTVAGALPIFGINHAGRIFGVKWDRIWLTTRSTFHLNTFPRTAATPTATATWSMPTRFLPFLIVTTSTRALAAHRMTLGALRMRIILLAAAATAASASVGTIFTFFSVALVGSLIL